MKKIKKNKRKFVLLIIFGLCSLWANNEYISYNTNKLIFGNSNEIPKTEYALFLGTPKYLSNGDINNYYKNRIKSATELYLKNKVQKIIVSADTLNKYKENEVELIKSDLTQKGVNESDIILDKNGNRTWNSITNIEENTSINKIVIISQKFHLERALYIAREKNINAIGYKAKGEMSNRLWIREILARVKMQYDLITD